MRLFDSHAHLTDDRFAAELDEVLQRAKAAGVAAVVSIASTPEDARRAIELARRYGEPRVMASAGIHPHEATRFDPGVLAELEMLAKSPEVVAIGETGLDFYYENAPRNAQLEAFRAQLELARELELPVVVHSREADEETASMLAEFADRVSGVLHCFSGGDALLEGALACDWYVSFSGLVTFAKFAAAEQVRRVPRERLLIETDSPYLAPVPKRGRRNEPAFVSHVARRLADLRGEDPERLAEATYRNACRLYGMGE